MDPTPQAAQQQQQQREEGWGMMMLRLTRHLMVTLQTSREVMSLAGWIVGPRPGWALIPVVMTL
jgi:hypothetical protein